jgi:colicin import membrane protein
LPPPTPDSIAETIADEQEKPTAESARLPDTAPAPQARPRPAEAQTAKAPERKASDKPVKEASSKPQSEDTGSIEDQVAALLNKQKSKGGGAKRSSQQAALGGKKTNAAKLSQGEEDVLKKQLGDCWVLPPGIEDGSGLRVSVRFNVDPSGKVEGQPKVASSSGNTIFDESALRAVRKCDHQGLNLPAQKAEIWSEIVVNFDPSEMF